MRIIILIFKISNIVQKTKKMNNFRTIFSIKKQHINIDNYGNGWINKEIG
jgi:hypothetical protein